MEQLSLLTFCLDILTDDEDEDDVWMGVWVYGKGLEGG